jgi:acetyltransferase-like isoleucine patch superfamily enzyme
MLQKLFTKIRKRENRFFELLYRLALGIRRFNFPSISWFHGPLFLLVHFVMKTSRYLIQKIFWEPLFKSQCEKCGKGLRIAFGIPMLSENLIIRIGDNVCINGINTFSATTVYPSPILEIGSNTVISHLLSISAGQHVKIGSDCLIGENVFISDNNGHRLPPNKRRDKVNRKEIRPISIGNNVWISHGVFIGPGVTIGDGAVIGFNSVVTCDIPANAVAAGVPAKVIKQFESKDIEPII